MQRPEAQPSCSFGERWLNKQTVPAHLPFNRSFKFRSFQKRSNSLIMPGSVRQLSPALYHPRGRIFNYRHSRPCLILSYPVRKQLPLVCKIIRSTAIRPFIEGGNPLGGYKKTKFILIFIKSQLQTLGKRKCLIHVEIAKFYEGIYKAQRAAHKVGCLFCVYIQVFGDT